ncbi:hypothetical protein LTR10_019381 [Elasticomyces elasticus]|uniref:Altered inheritance of mitochondria protein 21 n=1 Tax=Exophiala sideris TaxID=1016849 RepID=A0ABR0IX77_9EURO|nr:hypothetical protein LTR10_019381 [Elasticomyces elasticus]KAK5021422.1 hypothetical protein LTS07_011032 [Exophiala sideris]KAK5025420.1 hypothetical protein LTR13_010497 [Exophiala sideris]KAK5049271.1 hypothetical protein LTR69_011056 [Exophiala sideris]KAK5176944.1 hypothetical protein LTR44_010517 [Eurotiomycetes sp. CCFEE 6388]
MHSSQGSQRGTVADRIRAFQDVQQLESKAPAFNLAPRVLTQAKESGVYVSHGRRETPSFAPPAGRVSRDGNEGFRADGRPPVGSVFYRRPVPEQKDAPKTLPVRPVTSMGNASYAQTKHGERTEKSDADQPHRRRRSAEHVADPIEEIATARARLRTVAGQRTANDNQSRERAPTLAELNHMLDDAIGNTSTQPPALSDENTDEFSPTSALGSRPHTSYTDRRRSQPRGQESRRSIDSLRPRSSEDSERVHYDQSPAKATQTTSCNKDHDVAPESRQARKSLDIEPAQGFPPPAGPVQKAGAISPVKQRAAIFESLNKKPKEYDEAHDQLHQGHETPQTDQDMDIGKKKMHEIKFGETVEERSGTPLIPLTLPAMVKDQQESAKEALVPEEEQSHGAHEKDPGDKDVEQDVQRKSSFGWPFKWGIFSKTPPASTQQADHSDEAKQEIPRHTKPGVVQSRVHDLMQAANEKEDAEKRRRHAEYERISRWRSRGPPFVKEYVLREDKVKLEDLKPSQLPPLQVPIDEQAEDVKAATNPNDVVSEPRTPLQRAMTEKQVLPPPSEYDPPSGMSSPTRSVPRTPVRGRPRKLGHRLSIGEQFGIEQQFKLSPGPSRSASRNGKAGVKVEVEVRDSPDREGRERGEKIVIIRADIEAHEIQG